MCYDIILETKQTSRLRGSSANAINGRYESSKTLFERKLVYLQVVERSKT